MCEACKSSDLSGSVFVALLIPRNAARTVMIEQPIENGTSIRGVAYDVIVEAASALYQFAILAESG